MYEPYFSLLLAPDDKKLTLFKLKETNNLVKRCGAGINLGILLPLEAAGISPFVMARHEPSTSEAFRSLKVCVCVPEM